MKTILPKKILDRVFVLLLYLTAILFSLGQLGRISLFGQQINIYAYEVGLFIMTLMLMAKHRWLPLIKNPLNKLCMFFFVYMLFSLIINAFSYTLFENIAAVSYFMRLFVYFLFFMYLLYESKDSIIRQHLDISVWLLFILFAVTSFIQYFLYTDLRNLFYLGWDPHYYRLFGLFFDTYLAAAVFGLFLIYALFSRSKNTIYTYGAGAISLIALSLTFSRGAYIAIVFVVLYAAIRRKMFVPLFLCVALLVLGYLFAPKPFGEGVNILRSSTVYSRVNDYEKAIDLYKKHPIFGVGYNHLRYAKTEVELPTSQFDVSHAGASFHSSFMIILVTGGIVGIILYILFLFKIAEFNMFSQHAMIFAVFFSFTDNVLLHPFVLFLFFLGTSAAQLNGEKEKG